MTDDSSGDAVLIDEVDGTIYPLDVPRWRSDTGNTLRVSDLPGISRNRIDHSERSIWRYRAALPLIVPDPVSLGEGCTPLVRRQFRGNDVWFKLDWMMPTGSFKDRGASVMISILRQQGVRELVEDSSGNGGAAIAAYGAAAGLKTHILAPTGTEASKIGQIAALNGQIRLIPGPREATGAAALAMAETVFYASHNWHPFFIQGTKTLGYELWEDLGFRAPDNIVIPTGAGSNVLGCDLAFRELLAASEIERLPRLFVVQPANCASIVAAVTAGADDHVNCRIAPTIAEGTAIRRPIRIKAVLAAIRRSCGGAVSVSEDSIRSAALALAGDGLFVEPTSAIAACGFELLCRGGAIDERQTTAVILTGSGLKAPSFYQVTQESGSSGA